jgi:phospholipid N-methyltransferase
MIGEQIKKGREKLDKLMLDAKKNGGRKEDGEFMGYMKVFLDDRSVASVTPSSKYLVDRTIKAMALEDPHVRVVVEYGAAQGVMTHRILQKMRPDAKLIAIEFNEELFKELIQTVKDPRMIAVRGDVREIDQILAREGVTKVDRIVSGVPFAFFSGRGRHELLTKTSELLNPGGRFVAYQVTTHLIPLLKDYFSKVQTQFEVRNIPPHFVFTAHK